MVASLSAKEHWFGIIEEVLGEIAKYPPRNVDVTYRVIFSRVEGFFEIKAMGWSRSGRIHGSVIHIDVIDDKVIIRHNGTDQEIKTILEQKGIPGEKIVLDFIPEEYRKYMTGAESR